MAVFCETFSVTEGRRSQWNVGSTADLVRPSLQKASLDDDLDEFAVSKLGKCDLFLEIEMWTLVLIAFVDKIPPYNEKISELRSE